MTQFKSIIKTVLFSFFCLSVGIEGVGQTKDFQLKIENYRGAIQWEQSFDHLNWTVMSGATTGTHTTKPTKTTYYRAKITEAGCVPVYSNIKAAAQYIDTFIAATLINGIVELPSNATVTISNCKISSSLEEVSVSAQGQFEILVPDSVEMNTLVLSNQLDSVIMLGHYYTVKPIYTINVESTALGLLHLYPGITPVPAQSKESFTLLYKQQTEFQTLLNEVSRISKTNSYLFSTTNTELISLLSTLVKKPFNQDRLRLSQAQLLNPIYINSSNSNPSTLIINSTASFSYTGQLFKKDNTDISEPFNVAGSFIRGNSMAKLIYVALLGNSYNIEKNEERIDLKKELNLPPGEYLIKLRSGIGKENSALSDLALRQNMFELFCLTASGFMELSIPLKASCVKDIVISGVNGISVSSVYDILENGGSVVQDLILPILRSIGRFLESDQGFSCLPKTNFTKLIPIINLVDKALPSAFFTTLWKLSNSEIDACQYMDDEFYLSSCFKFEAIDQSINRYYTGDTTEAITISAKTDPFYYPYVSEVAALKRFVWFTNGSFAPDGAINPKDRTDANGIAKIKWIMPCIEDTVSISAVLPGVSESVTKKLVKAYAYNPVPKIISPTTSFILKPGEKLNSGIAIQVKDELDGSLIDMSLFNINWTYVKGSGSIIPNGITPFISTALFSWTFGLETDEQIVQATITAKNCNWTIPDNIITYSAKPQVFILSGFSFNNLANTGSICTYYKSCSYDMKFSFQGTEAPTSGSILWKIVWDNDGDGTFEGNAGGGFNSSAITAQNSNGNIVTIPRIEFCWGSNITKLKFIAKYKAANGTEGTIIEGGVPQY